MVRVKAFLRDPDGSMTQLGLVFLLLSLTVGGIAVDVMRHEGTRAEVQQALDACTQNLAVVERPGTDRTTLEAALDDCMTRAGLGDEITDVDATSTAGYASVETAATGTQQNQFMQMVDIASTNYAGTSAAAVPAAGGVEVVLAYDSSSVMSALAPTFRTGAAAFVDLLMGVDAANPGGTRPATSVGLVPYTNGVNLPVALRDRYSVTNVSSITNSNCIALAAGMFTTTTMPTATPYQTMTMADFDLGTNMVSPTAYFSPASAEGTVGTQSVPCPPQPGMVVRVPTNVASTVKSALTTAQFFGGARLDHGMHWASALLDPASNGALAPLVPAAINTRPLAYNQPQTQKVIVFVNRGFGTEANRSTIELAPAFATGLSPIWRNNSVTPRTYCINLPTRVGTSKFYQPALGNVAGAWTTACPATFTQLTWPQVWNSVRISWVVWHLYAKGMQSGIYPTTGTVSAQTAYLEQMNTTYRTLRPTFQQAVTYATQRSQFEAECAAAKAAGIVVYTVSFDAVADSLAPLRTCASSPAHYFAATSATFETTMRLIAQTIHQQAYTQ